MEKLKKGLSVLKKYPIVWVFFAFLVVVMVADMVQPDHEMSELENRTLTQAPSFKWETLVKNEWTRAYDTYTKDQFLFRDEWISTWSILEFAQGKLESNGVWFAHDGYQIAKNDVLTPAQQQKIPLNTNAVSELSLRHPGMVDVMIVPSPANILSSYLPWKPPQMNENAILSDMFTQFADAGATVLDLRQPFWNNMDKQLFYRTDHHWTTTGGAWIAYETFCEVNGLQAVRPPDSIMQQVPDFYGTNFSKTKRFGTKPDTLTFYDFSTPLMVYKIQEDGESLPELGPIMDKSKLDVYDKYAAFLRGNNGYSVLEGHGEGNILIIKDSYGNSFAPYLIQNYAKIGIVDLRYLLSVDDIIEEGEYDKILVLYSFASFSSDMFAFRMQDSMQK